jgi:starvation-inducible DNA-binding protein
MTAQHLDRGDVVRVMYRLIGLEQLVKEVHWNAEGPGFISIHQYLDEVYSSCEEYIDEIAEHLVAFFGAKPRWLASIAVGHFVDSSIDDGLFKIVAEIKALLEIVEKINDVPRETEDILVRLSQDFHKHGWFLTNEIS